VSANGDDWSYEALDDGISSATLPIDLNGLAGDIPGCFSRIV
jgi:hypothetical protein